MSEAPKQKRIDIKTMKFEAGGDTFYISVLLSTVRYVQYLQRLPRLSFNTSFQGMYESLSKIYMACSSGNDMIGAIQTAREISWNQLDAIQRFNENEIPEIIDFVALFCDREKDDPSKFDHGFHEAKKQIINDAGYCVEDFFQLAFLLIDSLREGFQKVQAASSHEGLIDLLLKQDGQQTNATS